ncbi:MAG: hypothetical protein U0324_38185 [Polyangiales bacterium]
MSDAPPPDAPPPDAPPPAAPPDAPPPEAPAGPPPPRDPRLLRWTAAWTLAGVAWTALTSLVILNTPAALRWLLFSGHTRYVLIAGVLLMMAWGEARRRVGERLARVYLAAVSTVFGVFGAVLTVALKVTPFMTILALASFSFGLMVLAGLASPVKLRKAREALEVVRRVAELTLAGVTLGPELGWLHTAIVLVGLAAMLVVIGDDVQALGDDARAVKEEEIQLRATTRAVDLYLSYFRLTLTYAELVAPRKKPKPKK